jgi:hypothetical protein
MDRKGPGLLPHTKFVGLTGEFAGLSALSSATGKPDERHVFVWVRVATGPFQGVYESAIDVHSNRPDGDAPDPEEVKYYLADEATPEGEWPPVGVNEKAEVSYQGLGLKESQFVLAELSDLHTLLAGYAQKCDRMTVFGVTYSDGTGIHDAHMDDQNRNEDGAVVFYFSSTNDGPVARWVFLKFQQPKLPD